MLQKTYSIYSDDLNNVQLFVEAGKNHIACWCKKENDGKIRAFEFFLCDAYNAENLEQLFDNTRLYSRLLTMPVTDTHFFWNNPEVLCLPKQKSDESFLEANFDLMFGHAPDSKIFSSATEECMVVWRLNNKLQHIAQQCFRGAVFNHQYSPLLSSLQSKENVFYLFFYPHYFTITALKANRLQFMQTVNYNTPEDVLYFVMNVCKQYDFEKTVNIFCGGYIDERSKLYDALYQYLEGLQLIKPDSSMFTSDEFKEYSGHYFLPYINYVV
ncbi:MAG: DUF3822 family protein [Parafilimonas sp.]|nr:DUF3822 family protein [Parafilimonas sp.]